jgi:uncharacterized protein (TIGR03663 family)
MNPQAPSTLRYVGLTPLPNWLQRTWQYREPIGWALVLLLAIVLRLPDLGSRALHHDEAQHARFSWDLYMGHGYAYNPMLHGPFLYHMVALTYYLFGVSDATARLAPAAFGVGLVALTLLLRPLMGRGPAMLAGTLLAFSPSVLYYSRSLRHDIFATFGGLLMAIGLMSYVVTRKAHWVYVATLGLVISYTSHELTFITGFIFVTYFGLLLLQDAVRARGGHALSPVGQATLELLRTPRTLAVALLIFLVPYTLLYTTFFTNPRGFTDGFTASISYWLSQQNVQRGGQPWYYYLLLLPTYEPVPVIFGGLGILSVLRKPGKGPSSQVEISGFLAYWSILALLIYSWAGEKMPWLTIQIALPLTLLASVTAWQMAAAIDWRSLWPQGALASLWLGLALAALVAVYSIRPPAATPELATQVRLAQVGSVALSAVAFAVLLGRSLVLLGRHLATVPLAAFLTGFLLVHTFHSSVMLNFYNGANPIEMMVYVQTTPEVPLVARRILDLSQQISRFERTAQDPTGGHSMAVALDNAAEWPFDWYLRDLVSLRYFNRDVLSIPRDAPVVIAAADNEAIVRQVLGNRYVAERHALRWWLQESYKRITLPSILTNPQEYLARGVNYFLFRRVGEPLGSYDFILYIRKDLAERYLGMSVQDRVYALTEASGEGSSPGQFSQPRGVAVGPDGSIYVVDTGNLRVQKFGKQGNFLAQWGGMGSLDGEFAMVQGFGPTGIAVGTDGSVYVADTWNHRIQKFDPNGRFLAKWGSYLSLRQGQASNQTGFYGPRGIAVDAQGYIYVTDTGNRRVVVFDSSGRTVRQFGGFGTGPGQFDEPIGITFDRDGNLLVADTRNQRIQRFTPEGSYLGEFRTEWSKEGINEVYLAVDLFGDILASDPLGGRVLVYDSAGRLKLEIRSASWGNLSHPVGIAVDAEGSIYITDAAKHAVARVQLP